MSILPRIDLKLLVVFDAIFSEGGLMRAAVRSRGCGTSFVISQLESTNCGVL